MSESGDSSAYTVTSSQRSPLSSLASSPAILPSSSPTVVLPKPSIKKDLTVKRPLCPTLAHPSTAVMVTTAIKSLKDKKGSTLPAIKKYMTINYQVDSAKFAPYIRRYLKSAVAKGELIQTNGTGANGNFKLPAVEKRPVAKKQTAVKKKKEAKQPLAKKRSIEGTTTATTTISKAKKPKKVVTDNVIKTKTKKKVEVAAKTSQAKPENSKSVAKKVPTKKAAPKNK